MSYVVTLSTTGTFYLRGTIFTHDIERAQRFQTPNDATYAIHRASTFHPRSIMKHARIVHIVKAQYDDTAA